MIAMLVLACLALSQGNLIAGLIGLDQPAAVAMHDGCDDPNDGASGNE
jgi:hypothetical protein